MDRTSGFFYEKEETKSWDEQKALLGTELVKLVEHAYANTKTTRERFAQAGITPADIKSYEDLPKIPVLSKTELARLQAAEPPFGGLLAVDKSKIAHIFQSPGPIYDPVEKDKGWGFAPAFYAAGIRPGDVCVNTLNYNLTPGGMMLDFDLMEAGCTVVPTGVVDRETQVNILRSIGVTAYLGMASFLVQIGEKAKELGIDPKSDLGLKVAFSIAEPLPDSLRNKVEEMFDLICRQAYGTADVGLIGYECIHKNGWHLNTRSIVEVVDPVTGQPMPYGEVGEVVVTPLKRAYPLLRFGTGDLSALDIGECACGRKGPKLRGWLGRSDQLIKIKGMFIHPSQVSKVFVEFPQYSSFRAIATNAGGKDLLSLHIEGAGDSSLAEAISKRARDVFRIGCDLIWCNEGTLPKDGRVLEDKRVW